MTFKQAFMEMFVSRINDASVTVAWDRAPKGAPVAGQTDIVLFYAPGGERDLAHDGMSGEEGRVIQVSAFDMDPDRLGVIVQKAHDALDGARGMLGDGTKVWSIVPGTQDTTFFDNDEKVQQTFFDVMVRMSSPLNALEREFDLQGS